MRGCSVIFHSAGAYPHGTRQIDREVQIALAQTRNVIEVAHITQPDRLIYTSSFTTIGLPVSPIGWPTNAISIDRERQAMRTTKQSGRWRSRC